MLTFCFTVAQYFPPDDPRIIWFRLRNGAQYPKRDSEVKF